jgi:hypothetical protein
MDNEFYLIVATDQYTGNWDSFLLGLLIGQDDDRYGWEDGAKFHVGFPADDVETTDHPKQDHDLPYHVEGPDNTHLSIALDAPLSETQRQHLIQHYAGKTFEWDRGSITIKHFIDHRVKVEKVHSWRVF